MYYPIIDKLKEVMSDLTSVKEKEPLVIEITPTSQLGGTWVGNYSDILLSTENNIPVYVKLATPSNDKFFIPLVQINDSNAISCLISFNNSSVFGVIYPDNTFIISPM